MKMLSAHRSGAHPKSGREIGRNNGGSGLRNSIPIKHLSCYWRFDSPTNSTDEAKKKVKQAWEERERKATEGPLKT